MVHASITTFNLSLLQGYDDMWVIQVPFIGDRVGLLPPPRQCYVSTLQQPPHDLPPFSENDRPSIPMPAKCLCMCARARERERERERERKSARVRVRVHVGYGWWGAGHSLRT